LAAFLELNESELTDYGFKKGSIAKMREKKSQTIDAHKNQRVLMEKRTRLFTFLHSKSSPVKSVATTDEVFYTIITDAVDNDVIREAIRSEIGFIKHLKPYLFDLMKR
jgi:hypothetical protein